jgi:aspartyl-tRNA(Asn)/glutamyl-tRNA(Gln) amidotransferase subunit A
MPEICWMSGGELVEAYRQKNLSPVEVLDRFLDRIDTVNPKINALNTIVPEQARAAAREAERKMMAGDDLPPLHGVPLAIKDNVFTAGMKTTFGSRVYQDYIPTEDAVLVQRLKEAGAIILGKTNLPEFGLIPVTDNLLFGPTRNPWKKQKTSGGSSGGSAAGVAAGLFPMASGNDGGGSIRIPASLCGVYGLKPSFGRVPCYPRLPGWETLNHEGPITRTVSDAALMLEVMAGPDERDRISLPAAEKGYPQCLTSGVSGFRVAYTHDPGYGAVDPQVKEITRQAAFVFEELGCRVDEVRLDLPEMQEALQAIVIAEFVAAHEHRMEEIRELLYPQYLPFLYLSESITGRDLARIQFKREELWKRLQPLFERYDILLTPTSCVAAFDSGEGGPMGPDQIDGQGVGPISWLAFTYPFNFTGQPAASVPCGFTEDCLPVGLQIVGRRYDEKSVLRASAAFEQARPWRQHRPLLGD